MLFTVRVTDDLGNKSTRPREPCSFHANFLSSRRLTGANGGKWRGNTGESVPMKTRAEDLKTRLGGCGRCASEVELLARCTTSSRSQTHKIAPGNTRAYHDNLPRRKHVLFDVSPEPDASQSCEFLPTAGFRLRYPITDWKLDQHLHVAAFVAERMVRSLLLSTPSPCEFVNPFACMWVCVCANNRTCEQVGACSF